MAFGASSQEKKDMAETLQGFARDTIMGKVLHFEEMFSEGVERLHTLARSEQVWEKTAAGLEYLVLGDADNPFIAVRIDPEKFTFTLCMASEKGQSHSIEDWALANGLLVAINASMYLPDERTSTGYMRNATHSNNARIGSRLGAFFVAEPLTLSQNPPAAIIEKNDAGWQERIRQYAIRVQNFRLLARDGARPWKEKADKERGSIAAIGQEKDGHILFLVSVHPMTVPEFITMAKTVAPNLENAMYVEGSVKVGMYLDINDKGQIWRGRKNVVYTPAPKDTVIPNVIGVVPRKQK